MIRPISRVSMLALALALPLAACEEGITDPSVVGGDAETTVLFSAASGGASASLQPSFSLAVEQSQGKAGPVALSDVKSIDVKIVRVQVLRADTAAKTDSVITLDVKSGGKINLLALPTKVESALQLAAGTLPAGTYSNLRLVFDSASITFKKSITAGGGPKATTYKADTAYALAIGDDEKSGKASIKLPTGSFTVSKEAGATVNVLFSGTESVKKIIVTPNGIKMPPVLSGSSKEKGKGKGDK